MAHRAIFVFTFFLLIHSRYFNKLVKFKILPTFQKFNNCLKCYKFKYSIKENNSFFKLMLNVIKILFVEEDEQDADSDHNKNNSAIYNSSKYIAEVHETSRLAGIIKNLSVFSIQNEMDKVKEKIKEK